MFHYLTGLGYTRTTRRIDLAGHFSLYLVVGFVGLRPAATSHSLDMLPKFNLGEWLLRLHYCDCCSLPELWMCTTILACLFFLFLSCVSVHA